MRLVSQIFQPIITIPKNAIIKNTEITCKSQKLLLECGLVRPAGSGLMTLLPLAQRALDKLEALAASYMESVGAQRVSLPSLTPAALWEKSGRLQQAQELFMLKDRHDKKYLLAPTHEESITELLADIGTLSYKQLPLILYQMSSKYRDEARPKHGLLRARQFRMLDAYSAHAAAPCARAHYSRLAALIAALFRHLRLPVVRVEAPTGEMGGSLSHEWQLPAAAGEDALARCGSCGGAGREGAGREGAGRCARCGGDMREENSIEVGHTFILGTRYSEALAARVAGGAGAGQGAGPLHMACYGLGLTRLLAASLEHLSSDTALRWPLPIAPYKAVIIGPKEGSKEWASHGWERISGVWDRVSRYLPGDVIVDDRHHVTIGKRLMMADKVGYPYIIVCGKSSLENPPRYEVFSSLPNKAEDKRMLTIEEIQQYIENDSCESETAINSA